MWPASSTWPAAAEFGAAAAHTGRSGAALGAASAGGTSLSVSSVVAALQDVLDRLPLPLWAIVCGVFLVWLVITYQRDMRTTSPRTRSSTLLTLVLWAIMLWAAYLILRRYRAL